VFDSSIRIYLFNMIPTHNCLVSLRQLQVGIENQCVEIRSTCESKINSIYMHFTFVKVQNTSFEG